MRGARHARRSVLSYQLLWKVRRPACRTRGESIACMHACMCEDSSIMQLACRLAPETLSRQTGQALLMTPWMVRPAMAACLGRRPQDGSGGSTLSGCGAQTFLRPPPACQQVRVQLFFCMLQLPRKTLHQAARFHAHVPASRSPMHHGWVAGRAGGLSNSRASIGGDAAVVPDSTAAAEGGSEGSSRATAADKTAPAAASASEPGACSLPTTFGTCKAHAIILAENQFLSSWCWGCRGCRAGSRGDLRGTVDLGAGCHGHGGGQRRGGEQLLWHVSQPCQCSRQGDYYVHVLRL